MSQETIFEQKSFLKDRLSFTLNDSNILSVKRSSCLWGANGDENLIDVRELAPVPSTSSEFKVSYLLWAIGSALFAALCFFIFVTSFIGTDPDEVFFRWASLTLTLLSILSMMIFLILTFRKSYNYTEFKNRFVYSHLRLYHRPRDQKYQEFIKRLQKIICENVIIPSYSNVNLYLIVDKLDTISKLKKEELISEEEFAELKKKIISSIGEKSGANNG